MDIQKIIDAYDNLKSEDGTINAEKFTDEQIDELIGLEESMLNEALPALVLATQIQTARRLKAEKQEALQKILIRRIMQRLGIETYDCEDGKVKLTKGVKYDINLEDLEPAMLMPNHASIRAKLAKGENVQGAIPTHYYFTPSIR